MIILKNELFDDKLTFSLELTKEKQLEAKAIITELEEPEDHLVKSAELKVLNQQLFDLI